MLDLTGKNFVGADSPKLRYMGRIDFSQPAKPQFYYAGSAVSMRFAGTEVSVVLKNHRFYNIMELGYVIDGKEGKVRFDVNDEFFCLKLCDRLNDDIHEITFFKRQDATHYFEFAGFVLDRDGEVFDETPAPSRKIECYGDSVSAGAVCEATDCIASNDPEGHEGVFDNAWHSYSMITARNLGAQINDVAQGGIAIFNGTGYYHSPNYIGMESVYDKLCYFPEGEQGVTKWNFALYTPQVVLFAVGQNDHYIDGQKDVDISDKAYRIKWKNAYKRIICDLMMKYPSAKFILLLTVLFHDPEWDNVLDEIKTELNSSRVTHFKFTRSGKATPGHPRLPEQYEMAEELTAYISTNRFFD